VRPRVVGVHRAGERPELVRQRREACPVGVVYPREVVADVASVGEHPGVRAGQLGKGGHDGQAELISEPQVRLVKRPDHLAAQLDDAAIGERGLLHAPAGPVPCLQHDDVRAAIHKIPSGAEARQAGADHHDLGFHGRILS
jgi:hypothetical protein